ncbi:MAG: MATE family efflux transporter [Bacteroidaceae bacterium]|nr:MATE family efflux transporter [Bacteroidaceae bacterium]
MMHIRAKSLHASILRIALPAIVSNVTVPLLGIIDTAIVGHLGKASYIGAIAVGSLIFSIIYWLFGFLRAATSGLTSQALGQHAPESIRIHFLRSAMMALAISATLLLLQSPIAWAAFRLLDASAEVEHWARTYFHIAIWGAPAVMLTKTYTGWFIGMQNTRIPMQVAIVQNIVNIPVSIFFVFCLHWNVAGVALGTVIAQYTGMAMSAVLKRRTYPQHSGWTKWKTLSDLKAIRHFLGINRDIFLRTVCIIAVTAYFTAASARQDDLTLAANTLLLQLFYIFSYIMDGFANAGEALSGKFCGARQLLRLDKSVRLLILWGWGLAMGCTAAYAVVGYPFLTLLTDEQNVLMTSQQYFPWVLAIPIVSFAAFLWDGIFIGLTATRSMLVSMFIATMVFFISWFCTSHYLHNHGLWMSFILYLAVRSVTQTLQYRHMHRSMADKRPT